MKMESLTEKAKRLFEENIKTDVIRMHSIEVEAIMKSLAKEIEEDEEKWAITGLVHDLDFEENRDLATHAKKAIEILKNNKFPEDIIHAVASHNEEGTGIKRESRLDYAIAAADNVSGLIYAYALMRKSLKEMEVSGLKKKMKDKRFAENVSRAKIMDIEKAGILLDKFLEVSIKAMESIADKIGFA